MPRKKPDLRVLGLGDANLDARLKKAAKAAGVETIEELADLVIDSGVSARPPIDPLTERMTLEDLGLRLWRTATQTPRTIRQQWFEGLVPAQKNAVVTVLRARGYAALVIANDFGITEADVEKIYAEHTTALGSQVLGVRLDTLAGQLQHAKQQAQQMAIAKGDAASFWRIEKEFVAVMQDLGVIDRATRRVEVVDRAEETKAHALERISRVLEMRAQRQAEMRQIEALRVDDLPDDIEAEFRELKTS